MHGPRLYAFTDLECGRNSRQQVRGLRRKIPGGAAFKAAMAKKKNQQMPSGSKDMPGNKKDRRIAQLKNKSSRSMLQCSSATRTYNAMQRQP